MDVLTGIPEVILKNLQDKSVEKRRQAAIDLQDIIEKLIQTNQMEVIYTRIEMFSTMVNVDVHPALSTEKDNPSKRRQGLYGLSVIAMTLYQKQQVNFLDKVMPPVIKSLNDKDPKVVLAACDAIFNIVKTCKEEILRYDQFLEIFSGIIHLIEIGTSFNTDVKEYSKKVDDLLKDVVRRSLIKDLTFNLDTLIDAICNKLRSCKNPDGQMVLIKWIETLHSITNVNILKCVPRFLEKMF